MAATLKQTAQSALMIRPLGASEREPVRCGQTVEVSDEEYRRIRDLDRITVVDPPDREAPSDDAED